MADSILFHEGNRQLQAEFGSEGIADRLESFVRTSFSESDKATIENAFYFFLATVDSEGRPDCSFKGGPVGFVRITAHNELAFPDYDGNGMFKSLGNITINPNIAMLFINLHGAPGRLRVNGSARVLRDDPLLAATAGAQLIVRVTAQAIFPNCPRYIPKMQLAEESQYVPRPGQAPVEPAWKSFDDFKDVVPPRRPTPL